MKLVVNWMEQISVIGGISIRENRLMFNLGLFLSYG